MHNWFYQASNFYKCVSTYVICSNYILKDGRVYKGLSSTLGYLEILPQNWHGYRNIGNEEAIILYYVTEKYNPKDPDEERITPEDLGVVFEDKIKEG